MRVCTEGLGLRSLSQELGVKHSIAIYTDSTAAQGTGNRIVSGRLRHVTTNLLWEQEKTASGDVEVHKVPRADNFPYLRTQRWDPKAGYKMLVDVFLKP